jgi:hypothetical protein
MNQSWRLLNSTFIASTGFWSPFSAASAAFCVMLQALLVLWPWSVDMAFTISFGPPQ